MPDAVLIIDVGDVLVATRPNAHYRKLAELTGIPAVQVARRIESAELPKLFERGVLDVATFVAEVRSCLASPDLTDIDVREAWTEVIGEPIVPMVEAIVGVARHHRVLLASNNNPLHWAQAHRHLANLSLSVPAVLSHEVRFCKPEAGFYNAVLDYVGDSAALLVDDKATNVAAARRHGVDGWLHESAAATLARIQQRFPVGSRPDGSSACRG